jgi:pimeloyl-ACP methyl ester carboxylesterase
MAWANQVLTLAAIGLLSKCAVPLALLGACCATANAAVHDHVVQLKATRDDARFTTRSIVLSDGAILAYYVKPGTGPTLVLVPETHGDRTQYYEREFLDHLSTELQLIVVESRGQGRSWPPPAPEHASIEQYASDVLAVVRELGAARWYVAGHSLGGMIAIEIAGRRPEGLQGVIALEGWAHHTVQSNAFPARPRNEAERAEARRQREERHRTQRWTPDEVAALSRIWTSWQSGERILRELSYPHLSVWGDRGQPRPTRAQLRLPESPLIELQWIEGADHYVTDAPFAAEVAKAITRFVSRVEQDAARTSATAITHDIVFRDSTRFAGWPANHGMWTWGDEIVVGFSVGWHQSQDTARHQIDRSRPAEPMLARSSDGGRTWSIERPLGLRTNEESAVASTPLREPMDFSRSGFALTLRYQQGLSFFFSSYDKGRAWHGPYRLPDFGTPGVQARTDYLVHGRHEMTVFLTVLKLDGKEGRPLCVRTTDGGMTWQRTGFIGPEPVGFAIMPSTVTLSDQSWLTAVRVKESAGASIDAWHSRDRGETWQQLGRPVPDAGGTSGNPPHLIRLRDGRLCLTYGYRSPPFGIRARLSDDEGRTWQSEIVLRADAAAHDLGYTRSTQRDDGRIVTVYYYNDAPQSERYIAATTWSPPARR